MGLLLLETAGACLLYMGFWVGIIMMMKFIRPVLNLKGPSLYYIIQFVQSQSVSMTS